MRFVTPPSSSARARSRYSAPLVRREGRDAGRTAATLRLVSPTSGDAPPPSSRRGGAAAAAEAILGRPVAPVSLVAPAPATDDAGDASATWVAQAQRGDRTAFRDLFRRHRGDVARLVFRMIGPRAEVDDLVQEVFVQVHRSLKDFRGDARFSTWLHRVTVNVVLMHRRAEKSRPVLTEEAPEGAASLDDVRLGPDADADRRRRVDAFLQLVAEIGDKKRAVFVLHDLEGVSPADIAQIVDAPVLTVRTRLFYARREIEEKMRAHPLLARVLDESGGFSGDGAVGQGRAGDQISGVHEMKRERGGR
jgi:RNA polymerase sigma-70 factor (ECF subfamily)